MITSTFHNWFVKLDYSSIPGDPNSTKKTGYKIEIKRVFSIFRKFRVFFFFFFSFVSALSKAPLSLSSPVKVLRFLDGILNVLATVLHGSIRTAPSILCLRLGLLRYLIRFTPLAFVSQC